MIKHWSKTQPTIALSVGEAEFTALVKAGTEGIGLQSLMKDLGCENIKITLFTDVGISTSPM